jgi:integrase
MTPSQADRKSKQNAKRKKRDRYDVASYRRAITYMIKKSGVPHWHPNQLRHSCGTRTRREHGLDAAQIILGHKQCDVTQVYAEVDRAKAIKIVSKCG